MVNDHRYTLVRTSEWPPERYSDSEAGDSDSRRSPSDLFLPAPTLKPTRVSASGGGAGMTSATAVISPVRRWRLLPGRNKHFCDGRIIMAKQTGVFYFTVGLIVVTSGLFFGFDCPFLATRVNPVLPVVGGVMFFFVLSTLFRTSFMDPGIIPRADSDEARDIEKQIEIQNGVSSPTYRPPPRTKEIVVNKVNVKLKYCFTCKIFRPPRASHCSICDNCVERFDHHCPWVGNCVGKRNYRFFYLFIVSLGFYCMFIFACVITHLALLVYEKNQRFLDAVQETPASLVVAIVCFLSVWSILGLAGFHTYLIFSNQTTNEDIKGSFSSRRGVELQNPYARPGFCGNCADILCGPFHPSLLRRREMVSLEEVSRNEAALRSLDREIGSIVAATAAIAAAGPENPSSSGSAGVGVPGDHPSYGTTESTAGAAATVAEVMQKSPMNGSFPQSQIPASSSGAGINQHFQTNPTPKRSRVAGTGGRVLPPLASSSSSSTASSTVTNSSVGSKPPPPVRMGSHGDGLGFAHPDFPTRFAYSSYSGQSAAPVTPVSSSASPGGGGGFVHGASTYGPPRVKRPPRRVPSFGFDTEDRDPDVVYHYRPGNREGSVEF